jgi:hypothetical protein
MIRIFIFVIVLFGTASFAEASQNLPYEPLVGIPGVDNAASNFNQYINQLYFLSISIAALLAVIKIITGGVKWMLTGLVTSKEDAKNDIRSALLGLLLIISAVLILGTINPQLTNLEMLRSAGPVSLANRNNNAGQENTVIRGGVQKISGEGRVSNESAASLTPSERAQFQEQECQGGTVVTDTTTGRLRCQMPLEEAARNAIVENLPPNTPPAAEQTVERLVAGRNVTIPTESILQSTIENGIVRVVNGDQTVTLSGVTASEVYFTMRIDDSLTRAARIAEGERICSEISAGNEQIGVELSGGYLACIKA